LGIVDGLLRTGSVCGLHSPERHAHDRDPLSPEEVGLANSGWIREAPLWFYVLKEADARHDGNRLGPVGGRIVGEVLTALIDRDLGSFRAAAPDWTPTLPRISPPGSVWPISSPVTTDGASAPPGRPHDVPHLERSMLVCARHMDLAVSEPAPFRVSPFV
jgi:hypothetical protein